jgi:hypothetical protein
MEHGHATYLRNADVLMLISGNACPRTYIVKEGGAKNKKKYHEQINKMSSG